MKQSHLILSDILLFLFRIDNFSFYKSWRFMNVSRHVEIPVNRISIGYEKMKVITDTDEL